ncbi:MAG: TerS protein [Pseudomonas sp.]
MTKPRSIRSDSASAAVQAAQNAAQGPLEPPPHVTLPEACKPFWDAVMRNRPRNRWNDADLAQAAVLARAQFDTARLLSEIEAEGDVTEGKANPKHVIVERLIKRASALSALLHVHAEATQGRAREQGKTLAGEQEAERVHDPLIPTLRAVS